MSFLSILNKYGELWWPQARPSSEGTARCSWVGLEWALPGVVVGVVMPLSVSVGNALELLISDIVVGVGVWSWSVDTLLTGNSGRWSVEVDGGDRGNKSKVNEFHFYF